MATRPKNVRKGTRAIPVCSRKKKIVRFALSTSHFHHSSDTNQNSPPSKPRSILTTRSQDNKPSTNTTTSNDISIMLQTATISRIYILDSKSCNRYMIDTGADVSVIPPNARERNNPTPRALYAANGSKTVTYDTKRLTFDLGLKRKFKWDFVIADVSTPIIGADFLLNFVMSREKKRKTDCRHNTSGGSHRKVKRPNNNHISCRSSFLRNNKRIQGHHVTKRET